MQIMTADHGVTISLPAFFNVPLAAPADASASIFAINQSLINGLIVIDTALIARGETPHHPLFEALADLLCSFRSIDPGASDAQERIVAEISGMIECGALEDEMGAVPSALHPHMLRLTAAYILAAGWLEPPHDDDAENDMGSDDKTGARLKA